MSTGPNKPWAVPEEDNMSIGELAKWLQALPKEIQHLPINIRWEGRDFPLNTKRLDFADGTRYYSLRVLQTMKTFNGIYLEIYADIHI